MTLTDTNHGALATPTAGNYAHTVVPNGVPVWASGQYKVGDVVRPTAANGFVYRCTSLNGGSGAVATATMVSTTTTTSTVSSGSTLNVTSVPGGMNVGDYLLVPGGG